MMLRVLKTLMETALNSKKRNTTEEARGPREWLRKW